MKKRKDKYKEPLKFLDDNLYESDMLSEMQLQQWEHFDAQVKKGKELNVIDFINTSTKVAANQIAKILEDLQELGDGRLIEEEIEQILEEIYKEIKE
jgi:hypothetical protein